MQSTLSEKVLFRKSNFLAFKLLQTPNKDLELGGIAILLLKIFKY